MVRRGLLLGMVLAWSNVASAQSVVVWLGESVPPEDLVQKADKLTGGSLHLAHVDLAFTPMPIGDEDAQRYDDLRAAVADGRARWDDFEVELAIATKLEGALAHIDVVRDSRDLDDLVAARLFQGTAASKAFEPVEFLKDERAEPFRVAFPGTQVNRPWLEAMMLAPEREFTKAELGDGPIFEELKHYQGLVKELSSGALDLSKIPPGGQVFVDGAAVDPDEARFEVRPGTHYVYVLRNDVVSGRTRLLVEPGATVAIPLEVDAVEVEQARNKVLEGSTTGFPTDLKEALDELMAHYPGAVFVAAVDPERSGKIEVLPYARNAQIIPPRVVTLVVAGQLGGGLITSSIFKDHVGEALNAPAVDAGFQMELGVYNAAVLAGTDLLITPGQVTSHAAPGGQANIHTPVLFAPFGGLGAYVLRPNGEHATLLLAGTYGWEYPAHMTVGGRASVGIPLNDASWFRVQLGIKSAAHPMSAWETWLGSQEAPLSVKFVRLGFASRF